MSVTISFEPDASEQDQTVVVQGLQAYNRSQVNDPRRRPIVLFLRDEHGAIQGGLIGRVLFNWLEIGRLWVAEAYRGQGHGTALILAAENEARKDRCEFATLDTFSFQARPFYESLGYAVFATVGGFPGGHERYFMKKKL